MRGRYDVSVSVVMLSLMEVNSGDATVPEALNNRYPIA
jgi:hypothetical protein